MIAHRVALIHALAHSVAPVNAEFDRTWPECARMNLLDDSLSTDLAQSEQGLDERMTSRFVALARYAIDTGARKIVYVDRGEGLFEPREVVTGLATERNVEILQGLKEGERVASSANFLIDSEAQLRGVVPLQRK